MKSTIKIDINGNLEPVIRIDKYKTEDVRDKLVDAWVERLGYTSNIALVEFVSGLSENGTLIEIRSMGTKENLLFMKDLIQSQIDSFPEPTDVDILAKLN